MTKTDSRMVSANAVIEAVSRGGSVYEGSVAYAVLKSLRLLDLLPPWYEVQMYEDRDNGWQVTDDDIENLDDAVSTMRMRQQEDTEPVLPTLTGKRRGETPSAYAARVARWAEEYEQGGEPGKPRKYRIREYRYGKRPRTVEVDL